MRNHTIFLGVILAAGAGNAAPGAAPGRHTAAERYEMFQNHLKLRAAAITAKQFEGVNSLEDWKRRRPEVHRQFLDMLGLDPMPRRTALNARVTGRFERDRYRVENIVFESMPGFYVTGNLYLPRPATGRSPAVLYVSGHAPGPAGAKAQYQHHGIWFASHGIAAFLLDTIEFGEIPGIHHGVHDLQMWHWLSLGYTPSGVEVWNAIRALDYLETRPEVDSAKLGMTGRSGGGAITWFTAAADERVRVAAPVHGTWSVGAHVADDVVRQNCDCIYFWNTYQLDLPVVGALIAPRPLMIVNAQKDGAFPPPGYRIVSNLLRPVYEWHGVADRIRDFELDTGHRDLPPYQKAANEWLTRWLTGDVIPFAEEQEIRREDASLLTVLSGYPTGARNEGIHRTFVPAHKIQSWKSLGEWQNRRESLLAGLKATVFRAFPDRNVPFETWKGDETVWTTRYADSFNVEFATEESVRVHGQLFVPRNGKPNHPALIYVKGKDDIVFPVDYDLILSALGNHVVLVLNPRAVDYPMDNLRTAATKMTAALLGTTLESMQLWDVLRSVDYLVQEEKLNLSSISVYGRKQMGVLAIYAAALDKRVSRVILDDPPRSHWQEPAFLNVLRVTDLAEAAGLVVPREIVSLTPLSETFRHTASIFRLYGHRAGIREVDSLAAALRVWESGAARHKE